VLVPERVMAQTLAEFPVLDEWQVAMVRHILGSGHGVDVIVGKAGSGKSYACQAITRGLELAGIPVLGCAPTAQAASELRKAARIDAGTLDKLLTEIDNGIRHIPHGAVILLDEAGMVSTRNRLALQRLADEAGAKVAQIGDHRQIPSVDVGGSHGVLAEQLGAVTLDGNHRFRVPQLREAAELIRDGEAAKGIALLRTLGMVYEHLDPAQVYTRILDDWQSLRAQGREVAMTAFENTTVDTLNQLARRHLIASGEIGPKGRTYRNPATGEETTLATGDRIRLEQNYGLIEPDGTLIQLYNGMRATITSVTRHGVQIRLDPDHTLPDGRETLMLPAWYAGAHVDYGYATTMDKTQGATVDDSLVYVGNTPSERAYVALSRGRYSNRIYARANSDWEDAIAESRTHTFATHQHPDPDRLAEVNTRILDRYRAAEQRRVEREARRRERGYATGRDRDGRCIAM
jgi:ATP-dependent exoDNAse (exonuclease V) alpha subunit